LANTATDQKLELKWHGNEDSIIAVCGQSMDLWLDKLTMDNLSLLFLKFYIFK